MYPFLDFLTPHPLSAFSRNLPSTLCRHHIYMPLRRNLSKPLPRHKVQRNCRFADPSDVRGNKGPPEVMEWRPHDPTLKQPKRRPETARTHLHALEELREIRIPLLIVSALVFLLGLAAISRYCCSGEPKRRRAKR